jgi:hypothetical protein
MTERSAEAVKKIIPFTQTARENIPFAPKAKDGMPFVPKSKDVRSDGDPVDRSGHAIVALLQQAAETANANCDRAMDLAHKLSMELRSAEERVRQLELEMRHYQDRAQRAEQWLVRIYEDIEQKFFESKASAAPSHPPR